MTTDSGEEYQVYANWIHNNNLDHWQGWTCDAGHTRFAIDKDFNVWSGECQNDYLGNALGQWSPIPSAICQRTTCTGCTDDLLTRKQQRD